MKILLIEDESTKLAAIVNEISTYELSNLSIEHAVSLTDAIQSIYRNTYDLIIFDMFLPMVTGDQIVNSTDTLIHTLNSLENFQGQSILITQYDIDSTDTFKFNAAGIVVVKYSTFDDKWKKSLGCQISKIIDSPRYDFLIFCALPEERQAFNQTDMTMGELINYRGLNCQHAKIGNYTGLCITSQRMGPIPMSITVTRALNYFTPKLALMCGICAGFDNNVNLLDLVICTTSWDYQIGKIQNGNFETETYQTAMNNSTIMTTLEQFFTNSQVVSDIKKDISDSNLLDNFKIHFSPMVSGSIVVADSDLMEVIHRKHRKLAGLDMEMSAFYEAANNNFSKPFFWGAKTVVDLGNTQKNSEYHIQGSILSARAITKAIPEIFEKHLE